MEESDRFEQKLGATFRQEALEHLLRLEGRLVALEQSGQNAGSDEAARMLAELHTLKGAARAVGKPPLAQLCHAFENVVSARGFVGGIEPGQFDVLHDALKVARKLVQENNGRTLNQARASAARLDALARELTTASPGEPAQPMAAPSRTQADDIALQGPQGPQGPQASLDSAIRVSTRHLDLIRQHAEEMLMVELDLQHATGQLEQLEEFNDAGNAQARAEQLLQHCRRAARDLERLRHRFSVLRNGLLDSALESSMEPFSRVFEHLPGLVRGLARSAGKEVVLHTAGEHTSVDRRILEPVRDILIQLATNAVDHGIESPRQRQAAGKAQAGSLSISVVSNGADAVEVTVADDGAGIDLEAVRAAAGQQIAADEVANMSPAQVAQLVFRPGLSTASTLTASSGRGVGLSLVADKLAAVGGEAELDFEAGRGCRFRLKLPVRLARMLGLAVRVRGQRFVLPLAPLKAVLSLSDEDLHTVHNGGSLRWKDALIPAISVARALGLAQNPNTRAASLADHHAVIARGVNGPFALLVDEILEEQEVLPKTLGKQLRRLRCLAGATQLADGALVPILAVDDLARSHQSAPVTAPATVKAVSGPPRLLVAEDSPTTRLLLKHILESAGYAVDTAPDGLEAWARLRGAGYDALVSDVNMPGLDGFSLCERVRHDGDLSRLPVVLVTSLQSAQEKERGLHAGADAYLSKAAFDQDTLLAALARLIAREDA